MKMMFDAHLPNFLAEVLNNQSCWVLKTPINIIMGLLRELAQLAIEIDDARLHIMMLRLGLYDCSATERCEKIKELEREVDKSKGADDGDK